MENKKQKLIDFVIGNEFISKPELQDKFLKLLDEISLPSVDEAGVLALNVSSNVRPKLTVQEQAMFIAGFQECIKYLNYGK